MLQNGTGKMLLGLKGSAEASLLVLSFNSKWKNETKWHDKDLVTRGSDSSRMRVWVPS